MSVGGPIRKTTRNETDKELIMNKRTAVHCTALYCSHDVGVRCMFCRWIVVSVTDGHQIRLIECPHKYTDKDSLLLDLFS